MCHIDPADAAGMTDKDCLGFLAAHLINAGGAIGLLGEAIVQHVEPAALDDELMALYRDVAADIDRVSGRTALLGVAMQRHTRGERRGDTPAVPPGQGVENV